MKKNMGCTSSFVAESIAKESRDANEVPEDAPIRRFLKYLESSSSLHLVYDRRQRGRMEKQLFDEMVDAFVAGVTALGVNPMRPYSDGLVAWMEAWFRGSAVVPTEAEVAVATRRDLLPDYLPDYGKIQRQTSNFDEFAVESLRQVGVSGDVARKELKEFAEYLKSPNFDYAESRMRWG